MSSTIRPHRVTPQPWAARAGRHRESAPAARRGTGWQLAGVGVLCAAAVTSALVLTGQAASWAGPIASGGLSAATGSPAAGTTGLLVAPVGLSTIVASARTAADAAVAETAAEERAATAAAATSTPQRLAPTSSGGASAKAQEAAFCADNPDLCTGGVPDKKSDRAEYQNDPRTNAEINLGLPMYAPEGVCPDGHARIAGIC